MSSKPDFIVTVKHKDSKYGTRVGACWKGQYGYSIKLDPGISISSAEGVYINLNEPRERDDSGPRGGGQSRQPANGGGFPSDDFGDIPF